MRTDGLGLPSSSTDSQTAGDEYPCFRATTDWVDSAIGVVLSTQPGIELNLNWLKVIANN